MRNFDIVIPGLLFRSGKYNAGQLRECVTQYNIKKVIDLRDRVQLLADSTYKKIGVTFSQFSLDETRPLPSNALTVFDGVTPTLIHCWKGAHRTGAWVATYRILKQGWGVDKAIAEMMNFGFGNPSKHIELYESVKNAG